MVNNPFKEHQEHYIDSGTQTAHSRSLAVKYGEKLYGGNKREEKDKIKLEKKELKGRERKKERTRFCVGNKKFKYVLNNPNFLIS